MKNQIVLSALAIVLCTRGFSQQATDSTRVADHEYLISLVPAYKNEIGVNLVPVALILSGEDQSRSRNIPLAHLFYKRWLGKNVYGRIGLSYNNGRANRTNPAATIRITPGNEVYLDRIRYQTNDYLQYFAGIEKRWGRTRVTQFAGLDLSYCNYRWDAKSTAIPIANTLSAIDSTMWHYKHTANSVGLHPFYGLNLSFSKHFFISAQVGFNMTFSSMNSQRIVDNRNLPEPSDAKVFQYDLNTSGTSNQISLGFRF